MTLNAPLYNITIDPEDNLTGMFLVSLVENPAVEVDFLAFNNEEKLCFAVQDEDKHIITGVAILADTPIYRRTKDGEFYVQFQKDNIPAIVEKFMMNGFANYINLQHNSETLSNKDAVMIESYFINKERGIVPNEFANVTDGSWCCSYKVLNDEIWQQIKAGDLKGFSIEIASNLEPAHFEKQDPEKEQDEEVIKMLGLASDVPSGVPEMIVDTIPIPTNNIILEAMSDASIEYAIKNKRVVMINYNGTEANGSRQCAVTAYGNTIAGNSALRIYQFYGDTTSELGWKIVLTKDITNWHVLDWQGFNKAELPGWSVETQSGETGTLMNIKYEI